MENIVKCTVNVVRNNATNRIKLYEAKYLKHFGKKLGPKVTVITEVNRTMIHIMDNEYTDFKKALKCLQKVSEAIVWPDVEELV